MSASGDAGDKPLTQQQKINICMGEVYRYRLALKEQLPAIEGAKADLKRAQEERWAYLFGAPAGEGYKPGFENTLRSWDLVERGRLKTELQFLLVATYGLYGMAKKLRSVTTGMAVNGCIQRAITKFDSSDTNIEQLRHVYEHMDEYALGGGRDRDKFPIPAGTGVIAVPDEDVLFEFGGLVLSVNKTVAAGEELSSDLRDCVLDDEGK